MPETRIIQAADDDMMDAVREACAPLMGEDVASLTLLDGCGLGSRLGLGRGASFDACVAVVRTAVDLGVNFLDTAEAYGTEEIVGEALVGRRVRALTLRHKPTVSGSPQAIKLLEGRSLLQWPDGSATCR